MVRTILGLFFISFFYSGEAQNNEIDSILSISLTFVKEDPLRSRDLLSKINLDGNISQTQQTAVLNNYALTFYYQQDYDSSVFYFKESLAIALEIADTTRVMARLKNIGLSLRKSGSLREALSYYLTALSYEFSTGYEYAALNNSIGTILHLLREHERAKEYYTNALNSYIVLNDSARISKVHNNLGITFFETGNHHKSVFYYLNSLKFNPDNDNALKNIGEYYAINEIYDSANYFLNKAWKIRSEKRDLVGMASVLNQYASISISKKEWKRAKSYLRESEKLLKQQSDGHKLLENKQMQKSIAVKLEEYKNALVIDQVIDSIRTSLFENERLSVNKALLQKSESENDRLITQKKLISAELQLEQQNSTIRLIILGTVVILTMLLAWYNIKSKKNREEIQKLNSELQNSNELTKLLASEISHKTKNSLQLLSSIIRLRSIRSNDKNVKLELTEIFGRVEAFISIHDKLLERNTNEVILSKKIGLSVYLKEVIDGVSILSKKGKIDLLCPNEIFIDMDKCLRIGLIVNEIGTNFIKYVLREDRCLNIEITQKEGIINLNISDNGQGFHSKTSNLQSFGQQLISSLIENLEGTYHIDNSRKGLAYIISIPANE